MIFVVMLGKNKITQKQFQAIILLKKGFNAIIIDHLYFCIKIGYNSG